MSFSHWKLSKAKNTPIEGAYYLDSPARHAERLCEKATSVVLDVLTPLSDCRHETVEKIMERKISGVSCMCWIDFHNGIWGCGFLCARLITLYFCLYFVSLFPATTPRATTPHPYHHGLSRLCIHPGYHTRAITLHHASTSGYHTLYW